MSDLEQALGIELEDGESDEIYSHWIGMPEYNVRNLDKEMLYKSIMVNVRSEDDLKELAKRMGMTLTSRTVSTWYPKKEEEQLKFYAWIDEEDLETYWDQIEEIIE